jgi:cytochrome b561
MLPLALTLTVALALDGGGHPLTLLSAERVDWMLLMAGSAIGGPADRGEVHAYMGDAITGLAGLHDGAALLHHAWMKDDVLAAMQPEGLLR